MTQNLSTSLEASVPGRDSAGFRQDRAASAAGFDWPASGAACDEARLERRTVQLDESSLAALRSLASDDLGEFTIAVASVALLIARYSGRGAVMLWTPSLDAGSWENMRPVPLVIDAPAGASVRDYLHATAEVVENSYSAPIATDSLPPEASGIWLCDERLHRAPFSRAASGVLRFVLRLAEGEIDLEFDAGHIEPFIAEGLAGQLARVIGEFRDLDRMTREIDLLDAGDRNRLLIDFNRTQAAGLDTDVVRLFEECASRHPGAIALTGCAQPISYRELNERANRLANYLHQAHGLGPEQMAGVLMDRSDSMIVAVLGILKCGAAFVPVDPDCPAERIRYVVNDTGLRLLLTETRYASRLGGLECETLSLPTDEGRFADESGNLPPRAEASQIAYVIYTSGSTGAPKGCQIERGSFANYINWANRYYFEDDSCGNFGLYSSLAFDFTITCIFCALTRGKTLRIYPQQDIQSNLSDALDPLSGVDALKLTPSHIHLIDILRSSSTVPRTTRIRKAIVGGEEMTGKDVAILRELNPDIEIYNEYGPTEATVGCIVQKIGSPDEPVLIGTPIANTRVYILDASGGLVPLGARGEICLAGDCLARGYLNRPEATEEKFVADPFQPGERMYRTGDIGRWLPDGNIQCFGREDRQVKIGGHRVELGEVESVLLDHPRISQAAVVLRQSPSGEKRLAAYLVAPVALAPEIRSYAASKLPHYMVPAHFVYLPALPLTRNGKIDRAVLPEPDAFNQGWHDLHVPPSTAIQKELAAIWCELFGLERVGIAHNFFDLGGDSLTAARLVSRVWSRFAVEIGIDDVFELPTIAALAPKIESADPTVRPSGDTLAELPAVAVEAHASGSALPYAQRRLWFLAQFEDTGTAYNISSILRLEGELDRDALERAFCDVILRQEALRTVFPGEDGKATARVLEPAAYWLPFTDLLDYPVAEAVKAAMQVTEQSFDLSTGPLFRAALFRLTPGVHLLAVSMHHIVSDGWSMNVLIREMCAFYQAHRTGTAVQLPELSVPYSRYAAWQEQRLEGERGSRQLEYWKRQLVGAPELLELPTDRPRPPVQTYRGGLHRIPVPERVTDGLRSLAQETGSSLFMALLSAYAVFLSRYSRQNDLTIGVPVANRNAPELEPLIGLFVNTLPFRIDLDGNPEFRDLLKSVKSVALAAFEHQEIPFEQIVAALDLKRDTSHSPLFQVMFAYESAPRTPVSATGLQFVPLEVESTTAKFDLTLYVEESGAGLSAALEYNSDLFDAATIGRMGRQFAALLDGIVGDDRQRVRSIPMLPEEERELLAAWNRTEVEYDLRPIHYLFEDRAAATPDAIAAVCGDEQLTYAALNDRANCLAHHLHTLGVARDVPVGIAMERSLEMIAGLLGILKAGGAYVPIDPEYPAERVRYIVEDCQAPVTLTQAKLLQTLPTLGGRVVCIDRDWEEISRQSGANPERLARPGDLAYIIYTSGSTGGPKGAMNEHASVCNRLLWMQDAYGLTAADRILQKTPFSFDVSVWEFFWPLITGARLVFAKPGGHRDSRYLVRLIREQEITTLHFVPSMLRVFLEEIGASSCDSLRRVICSGEALPFDLQEQFFECFGEPGRVELHNLYGPTEAAVDVTAWHCRTEDSRRSVPIGRPIANTQIHVVDEDLRPVPVGVPGELLIGGVAVGRGYWRRDELTAAKFISDTCRGRLYRTGDLARYRTDGAIEFLGRIDHQVKIRGFRIEPAEIEDVLRGHPEVQNCVLLALEERGVKRLVAYVVTDGRAISDSELRAHIRSRLPEYMTPSLFVPLQALPLLPNGKLNRNALPHPSAALQTVAKPQAPRNAREHALVEIWCSVLDVERVGIHDNFFALGGDSILSIQVVARASQAGLRLALGQIFQHQTIAELAAVAEEARAVRSRFQSAGKFPLTPVQRWFFDQDQGDPAYFNQSVLLGVPANIDMDALRQAFRIVSTRHDTLRSRFGNDSGHWMQEAESADSIPDPLAVAEIDADEEEKIRTQMAAAVEEAERKIRLSQPLMQARLFRIAGEIAWRLFIVVHHLAIDAVSWRVLLEDLYLAYTGSELPPLTAPFEEWAAHLRGLANSPELAKEVPFWTRSLTAPVRPLPLDYPSEPGANRVREAQSVMARLSEDATRVLLTGAGRAYNTRIDEILLTALALALRSWTGDRRLRVDLESHGRESFGDNAPDVSRTVGWFTSIYPVLLETGETGDPGNTLKSIKEQLRRVPHHGIGYGLLPQVSGAQRAEILFNYLGRTDGTIGPEAPWSIAQETIGSSRGPDFVRSHCLEINAAITGGQLQVDWIYSGRLHQLSTIESLAHSFLGVLNDLIAHCHAARRSLTPSDVPRAGLSQQSLDDLLARLDPENVEDIYQLSPMQQGMLFHSLLEDRSNSYFEQISCTFRADDGTGLNPEAFRASWQRVVDRHAILRTSFHWRGLEHPVQMVAKTAELCWREIDSTGGFEHFLEQDRQQGLDLSAGPPMRCTLIRTGPGAFRFCWSHHHALLDGWSAGIVLQEVFDAYRGILTDTSPAPYRRYIDWLSAQDQAEAEQFWRRELDGFDVPTLLAGSQARDRNAGFGAEEIDLSASLSGALRLSAQRQRLTVNTLFVAAWSLVLSRYSGSRDVLFGLTVSGRPPLLPGVESMVGLFINTLPARIQIDGERQISGWLAELHSRSAQWIEHGHVALTDIRNWTEIAHDTPLFDSILVFEDYPAERCAKQDRSGIEIADFQAVEESGYPLTLAVIPGEAIHLRARFDRSRFADTAVRRILSHLEMLLQALAADVARPVGTLPPAGESDLRQLQIWNETGADFPEPVCFHEAFERQTARTPDAPALICADKLLSFRELNERANRLARYLQFLGVAPETPVALCFERSAAMIVALLAVLKAGGAYVPIDPESPPQRMLHILRDCAVDIVLSHSPAVANLPEHGGHTILVDRSEELAARFSTANLSIPIRPDNLIYVIYTSGTTGRPKGVMVEHRNVWNLLQALDREIYRGGAQLRIGLNGPLAFDTSVKQIVQLANGHTLVVVPEEVRLDPSKLLDYARSHRLDSLDCTPLQLESLVEHGLLDGPPVVARMLIGGEAIPREMWKRLSECGAIDFYNVYGPTEATVDATCAHICRDLPEPVIGRPLPNVRTYVLDADRRPVPIDAVGELFLGGKGVAHGYRGDTQLTAERFLPDPFQSDSEARMYRTGDLVRHREDGSLEFLGRVDRQLKIRGFRIEPAEIESVLEEVPGVQRAVVACSENSRLMAYVVPQTGHTLDVDDLRGAVLDRLPPRMAPAHFVLLEKLPLTRHGKVDYRALPPPNFAPHDDRPPTSTEQRLLPIWRESLSRQTIGIDDDFFDLGGHSLTALRLMARVEHEFGKRLPIAILFRHPTVRTLAQALSEQADAGGVLVPIRAGNEAPPLFLLPGAGGNVIYYRALAALLIPGRPVYGIQAAGLDGLSVPLGSVEEIAAANLREMRKVAPTDPYFLAGHSFGGKVAFEMSQQLRRQGDEVALLAIFDTPAPAARTNSRKDWDDAQWLAAIAYEIGVFLGRDLKITRADLTPLDPEERLQLILSSIRRSSGDLAFVNEQDLRAQLDVYKTSFQMNYIPPQEVYGVPIALFQAADSEPNEELPSAEVAVLQDSPAWGWERISSSEPRVFQVDGNHLTMLLEPHVRTLADHLNELLTLL